MNQRQIRISKHLSFHLRHRPDKIGIMLADGGWVPVEKLLSACAEHGFPITREELDAVVAGNDKQRFSLVEDGAGARIRANQGHSVPVDLGLMPKKPPALLYHGTPSQAVPSILQTGLQKMRRHHVHLSANVETARKVGARRGAPVILEINAAAMDQQGHLFYCSANGVWLTEAVPPPFVKRRAGQ